MIDNPSVKPCRGIFSLSEDGKRKCAVKALSPVAERIGYSVLAADDFIASLRSVYRKFIKEKPVISAIAKHIARKNYPSAVDGKILHLSRVVTQDGKKTIRHFRRQRDGKLYASVSLRRSSVPFGGGQFMKFFSFKTVSSEARHQILQGSICQMFSAYSFMLLSDAKYPAFAILVIAFFVQRSLWS